MIVIGWPLVGGVKNWLTLQTRSKNILVLSLNLGSLCDESQSLVYCAVFFNWASDLQVSAFNLSLKF